MKNGRSDPANQDAPLPRLLHLQQPQGQTIWLVKSHILSRGRVEPPEANQRLLDGIFELQEADCGAEVARRSRQGASPDPLPSPQTRSSTFVCCLRPAGSSVVPG